MTGAEQAALKQRQTGIGESPQKTNKKSDGCLWTERFTSEPYSDWTILRARSDELA